MYVFVVNANSGNGRALKVWDKVKERLEEKRVSYHVIQSESRKMMSEQLTSFLLLHDHIKAVIAVGGDGTIHEVLNHIVKSNITLGVIPTGTGNDFARTRHISSDYLKELDKIIGGSQQTIDTLILDKRHCVTVIGLGFDAMVAKVANGLPFKRYLGSVSYIISVLMVLINYQPSNVEMELDQRRYRFKNVWLVALGNHSSYGGGMNICPKAVSNDGLMDLCIVHGISRWKLLMLFPGVFTGKHLSEKGVEMLRGKVVEIESDQALIVHGDGEMIGETPIKVTVAHRILKVVS